MNPTSYSRYPRIITVLIGTLATLGFLVAIFGSTKLMMIFGVIYIGCFIAWAVMADGTGGDR